MNAYYSATDAQAEISTHSGYYNAMRPHQSLGSRMPDEVYFQTSGPREAA